MNRQTGSRRKSNASCSSHWPPRRSGHGGQSPRVNMRSPKRNATASRLRRQREPKSRTIGCWRPRVCGPCSVPHGGRQPDRRTLPTCGRRPTAGATPTAPIFDHAAFRIRQEVGDRLDPLQVIALAAVQEFEHEHQATVAEPVQQPADVEATDQRDLATPRGFDDPHRRELPRARLVAAGVPDPAMEGRTLADLGQAREAAEAAQTPVATAPGPRDASARSASHESTSPALSKPQPTGGRDRASYARSASTRCSSSISGFSSSAIQTTAAATPAIGVWPLGSATE